MEIRSQYLRKENLVTQQILDPETGEFVDYREYQAKQKAKRLTARAQVRKTQVRWAGLKVAIYLQVAVLLLGVVIALIVTVSGLPYEKLTVKEFDATVTSQLLCGPEKTKYCLVVTYDDGQEEVLQNADSLWWWKWNSADYQASLQPGNRYHFTVYGWRWPLFSMFRNIVAAEPIGQ